MRIGNPRTTISTQPCPLRPLHEPTPWPLATSLQSLLAGCRRELRLGLDRAVDCFYGIDTVMSGRLPHAREASRFEDAFVNGPVSYWLLHRYVDRAALRPDEVFYDIGCGDGRVLCFIARKRIRRCVGVELSADFADNARRNAAALRGRRSPIEVRVGDAAGMDYADGTTFYFGDPFGADTMREVLGKIRDTVATHPRPVRCIFILRKQERPQVEAAIRTCGWLVLAGQRSLPYSPMRAEHWTYEPTQAAKDAQATQSP